MIKSIESRPGWDEYFMLVAKLASTRSTCNSRPTGAVIVKNRQILATGYNGASSGMEHCLGNWLRCPGCQGTGKISHRSPEPCPNCKGKGFIPYCHRRARGVDDYHKQNTCRSNHAEANAVAMAARHGIRVSGADIYCTLAPCHVCLKLLKAAEIDTIYYELAYEDLNREGIYASEKLIQVELTPELTDAVAKQLQQITSERRLPRTA